MSGSTEPQSLSALAHDPALRRLAELEEMVFRAAAEMALSPSVYPVVNDRGWSGSILSRVAADATAMVIGQVSTGKSSLINSLLGERLLRPGGDATDGVISVLHPMEGGGTRRAEKVMEDGSVVPFETFEHGLCFLRQDETPIADQLQVREVRLYLEPPLLRQLRLVNTPGLGDRLDVFERVTLNYLKEHETDLIIWTFYPDQAVNEKELATFSEALEGRRGTVLGVVTNSLARHPGNTEYDPYADPEMLEVVGRIQRELGKYLSDVILYDSHEARRLVQGIHADPSLTADPAVQAALRRCGYTQMIDRLAPYTLGAEAGRGRERVRLVIQRCAQHAQNLKAAAEGVQRALQRQSADAAQRNAAWVKVHKELIVPSENALSEAMRGVAETCGAQLANVAGTAAADAVMENFGLVGTLLRVMGSWIRACDPAAEHLTRMINEYVDKAVKESRVQERFQTEILTRVRRELTRLSLEVEAAGEQRASVDGVGEINLGASPRASGVDAVFTEAISASLKAVVGGALQVVVKEMEKRIAEQAAKEAAEKVAEKVVEKTAQQAVQEGAEVAVQQAAAAGAREAGAAAAGAAAARILSIVSLVLVPFDIAKLFSDFKEGRETLAKTVLARYEAQKSAYAAGLHSGADLVVQQLYADLVADAREVAAAGRDETERRLAEATGMVDALDALAVGFAARSGGAR